MINVALFNIEKVDIFEVEATLKANFKLKNVQLCHSNDHFIIKSDSHTFIQAISPDQFRRTEVKYALFWNSKDCDIFSIDIEYRNVMGSAKTINNFGKEIYLNLHFVPVVWELGDIKLLAPVCECGADAIKAPFHSDWCPKHDGGGYE